MSTCNNGQWNPPFFAGCTMSNEKMLDDTNTPTPDSANAPKAMGSLTFTSAIPQIFGAVLPTTDFNLKTGTTNSFGLLNTNNNGMGNNFGVSINSTTNSISSNSGLPCIFGISPVTAGTITYSQGNVLGPYPAGTTANLQCINKKAPIGATAAFCANGLWSPMILGPCNLMLENSFSTGLQQSKF